jgi:hypothetical protein
LVVGAACWIQPAAPLVKAIDQSLILYAEHGFAGMVRFFAPLFVIPLFSTKSQLDILSTCLCLLLALLM